MAMLVALTRETCALMCGPSASEWSGGIRISGLLLWLFALKRQACALICGS